MQPTAQRLLVAFAQLLVPFLHALATPLPAGLH